MGINGSRAKKKWFNKFKFTPYWDLIIEETVFLGGVSFAERVYCIAHDITEVQYCSICNERSSFPSYAVGYRTTCGKKNCHRKAKSTIKDSNDETPDQRGARIRKEKYSSKEHTMKRSVTLKKAWVSNNAYTLGHVKSTETKKKTILDNGLTIAQDASRRAAETMRKQVCANGKTILQNRLEKGQRTKEIVGEDGLDGYERAFKNCAGKNASVLYYATGLYYQGSYEKEFLDDLAKQGLITTVKRGPRVYYKNANGKTSQYRSDFIIGNLVYEVKSCWTYDHCGKNKKRRVNNKLKLRALKRNGFEVIMVYNKREITFSELIKRKVIQTKCK